MTQFALMQAMAASIEHLIDPAPSSPAPTVPRTLPCRLVDALAGDCSSTLGARLRQVDAECGFGQRCTRHCAHFAEPDSGFAGNGRLTITRVVEPTPSGKAGNDNGF